MAVSGISIDRINLAFNLNPDYTFLEEEYPTYNKKKKG
jgi:hypothetical protein